MTREEVDFGYSVRERLSIGSGLVYRRLNGSLCVWYNFTKINKWKASVQIRERKSWFGV